MLETRREVFKEIYLNSQIEKWDHQGTSLDFLFNFASVIECTLLKRFRRRHFKGCVITISTEIYFSMTSKFMRKKWRIYFFYYLMFDVLNQTRLIVKKFFIENPNGVI